VCQCVPGTPRRALIVSAAIGEGHHSVGRALEEAIARAWPGCQVAWLDILAVMGPGIGPMARASYRMQVQHAPWLYEFFFSAIWRHRWFLDVTRRPIGSWCGRLMAPRIRSFGPDVIISTYPLGSAGLSWLRERRRVPTPAGAWVSDFCPHPYWVYRNLDVTFVMHPAAVPVARRAEPGARVAVGALPVTDAFGPSGRAAARARLGLDGERFTALLSTGSLAFGGVDRAVTALLAASADIQVVAICGRNERLRRRLAARGEPPGRLRVLGWTGDMPGWITASDVVVTNGGGVTALEAISSGRRVIMFEPIAGHGRANAALMASSGSALLAPSPPELTTAVSRLAGAATAPADPGGAAPASGAGRRREDDLAWLATMRGCGPIPPLPVRAEDALFLHVQTPGVPQQVGAVVTLAGHGADLPGLRSAVAARVSRIPQLRRCLLPARGRLARARWAVEETVDVCSRITQVTLGTDGTPASLDQVVGRFFAVPLDPRDSAWQMLLVQGLHGVHGTRSAIVVKVHHALGDSYALISALSGLFDPAEQPRLPGPAQPRQATARAAGMLAVPRHALRIARGLLAMALAGPARPACINGATTDAGRRFAAVSLDSRAVTITARRLGGSSADLVLALIAEALGRLTSGRGEPTAGRTVRVMVPRTLRAAGAAPRSATEGETAAVRAADVQVPGNRAAGLLLDLPVGPTPAAERVAAVRALRQARLRRGDADASAAVLRAMNLLPPPLQRAFARAAYTSRRFNLIVSVFPGVRQGRRLLGSEITGVYPVLALADGVGLAVGAMTWGRSLYIGLLADEVLVPDLSLLAAGIERAFAASKRTADGRADGPREDRSARDRQRHAYRHRAARLRPRLFAGKRPPAARLVPAGRRPGMPTCSQLSPLRAPSPRRCRSPSRRSWSSTAPGRSRSASRCRRSYCWTWPAGRCGSRRSWVPSSAVRCRSLRCTSGRSRWYNRYSSATCCSPC
jgi:diacylglycerol O-acyltransferase / wax synthase